MNQTATTMTTIGDYFSLAYDPSSREFDNVFHKDCTIQWLRDRQFESFTAEEYRSVIYERPSPSSLNAPRDEAILSISNISENLSAATVRVRIGKIAFIDHLVLRAIDGKWLITSKASYVAHVFQ